MQTNALALNFLGVCRLHRVRRKLGLRNLAGRRTTRSQLRSRALQSRDRPDWSVVRPRRCRQPSTGRAEQRCARRFLLPTWSRLHARFRVGSGRGRVQTASAGQPEFQPIPSIASASSPPVNTSSSQAKHWLEQCITADPRFATAYLNLASTSKTINSARRRKPSPITKPTLIYFPSPNRMRMFAWRCFRSIRTDCPRQATRARRRAAKTTQTSRTAPVSTVRNRTGTKASRRATRGRRVETSYTRRRRPSSPHQQFQQRLPLRHPHRQSEKRAYPSPPRHSSRAIEHKRWFISMKA